MLVEKAFETDSAIEKQGSSIEQIGSQIDAKVWKSDITASVEGKADTSWVESEISSQVNQSAESVTYKFMQSLSETNNLLTQHKTEVSAYQRFSEEGLELGRSDSPLKAKLSNEKLAFEHNGVEVAYISNQKMYITEANVTDKLSVGNENGVCFEWRTTRGGIGLKWIGKV